MATRTTSALRRLVERILRRYRARGGRQGGRDLVGLVSHGGIGDQHQAHAKVSHDHGVRDGRRSAQGAPARSVRVERAHRHRNRCLKRKGAGVGRGHERRSISHGGATQRGARRTRPRAVRFRDRADGGQGRNSFARRSGTRIDRGDHRRPVRDYAGSQPGRSGVLGTPDAERCSQRAGLRLPNKADRGRRRGVPRVCGARTRDGARGPEARTHGTAAAKLLSGERHGSSLTKIVPIHVHRVRLAHSHPPPATPSLALPLAGKGPTDSLFFARGRSNLSNPLGASLVTSAMMMVVVVKVVVMVVMVSVAVGFPAVVTHSSTRGDPELDVHREEKARRVRAGDVEEGNFISNRRSRCERVRGGTFRHCRGRR